MIDVRLPELRAHAFEGNFGLEREALRVTDEGRMAHTPHPFSADHPRVVRDFCENQTEINTRVWPSAEEAVAELESLNADILREIAAKNGELLWPFSNPPPLEGEDDVIPAKFTGHRAGKSAYRDYLSSKYGRYLMTYCGIHVNFSFGERLLAASGAPSASVFSPRRARTGMRSICTSRPSPSSGAGSSLRLPRRVRSSTSRSSRASREVGTSPRTSSPASPPCAAAISDTGTTLPP